LRSVRRATTWTMEKFNLFCSNYSFFKQLIIKKLIQVFLKTFQFLVNIPLFNLLHATDQTKHQ
jgi:hypothetical protein